MYESVDIRIEEEQARITRSCWFQGEKNVDSEDRNTI